MLKFKILGILILALVIISLIGFFLFNMVVEEEQSQALQRIELEFVDIVLNNVEITNLELGISVDMYNPNDVTAKLDTATFDLWFNDKKLGSGSIDQQTNIPPFTSRQIQTDLDIGYLDAGETIVKALTEEQHNWRLDGYAHYETSRGTIDVPFNISK